MAGALRKTMVYLGLAEDDDAYDRYDDGYDERRSQDGSAPVTQLPTRNQPVARVVREHEVGPLNRITTIHPRTYNEAKSIGDAKRLVDFAAGLVFGLRGTIERVTAKVFLLSPEHVEVAAEEPPATRAARGPFNQS